MKKVILLVATLLLARENPFVLPQHSSKILPSANKAQLSSKKKQQTKDDFKQIHAHLADGEKIIDLGFLSLFQSDKRLQVRTKDPLKKSFILNKPKKVVFDFKASQTFTTKRLKAKAPFKKITIGSHDRFYRVVVEVDRTCHPKIDSRSLMIECR